MKIYRVVMYFGACVMAGVSACALAQSNESRHLDRNGSARPASGVTHLKSDRALAERVRHVLAVERKLHSSGIVVFAKGSKVFLSGSVSSPEEGRLAMSTASKVPGVSEAIDKLTLRYKGQ